MTNVELASLAASIASLVLAIVAILLSLAFFRMSSDLSQRTTEAAKDIAGSVHKLEDLFNRLYADTFGMMRDTVTETMKHAWTDPRKGMDDLSQEVQDAARKNMDALKTQVQEDLTLVLQRQQVTEEKVSALSRDLGAIVQNAIDRSASLQERAFDETLRKRIIETMHRLPANADGSVLASSLVQSLAADGRMATFVIDELNRMQRDNLVTSSGDLRAWHSTVRLVDGARLPTENPWARNRE